MKTTFLRDARVSDFSLIRKLPVPFTYPPVSILNNWGFLVMASDANVRLLIFENAHKPAAFMAVNFMPAFNSPGNFLVITHFATERNSMDVAAEMEEHISGLAREQRSFAVLVRCNESNKARAFFESRGYTGKKEQLIKMIKYA